MFKPLSLDKILNLFLVKPYLFTYIFKMCYFHPHLPTHTSNFLPTCPCTFLPTNLLNKYLLDPTYMVAPTYLVGIQIDLAIAKNKEGKKREKGIAWSLDLFI